MEFFTTGGEIMAASDWDWPTTPSQQKHSERVTMIRPIQYESTSPIDPDLFESNFSSRRGKALTINISSGGMLLVMDHAPEPLQLLKVHVPVPIHMTHIPTLAEVAWTRPVPMGPHDLHFVGLKFVL
ncbi:PilZ domain-containing protein [Candidatus Nitrospira bockiana]